MIKILCFEGHWVSFYPGTYALNIVIESSSAQIDEHFKLD